MLQLKFFLFKLHSMRAERGLSRTFMRFLYNPCEPKHLAWQWQVKNSPAIARCSDACLRRKECPPKRFFPRFLSVNVAPDGRLLPSPVSRHSPQSEMSKPSCKSFHTSTCLLSSNEDPPRNAIDNLQPNKSPINMDRLTERAGFQLGRDSQEKKKNLKMPKSPIFASRLSEEERAEEELEEVERELEMSPEEKEALQREFERLSKSPLQLLTQKQLARKGSSAPSLPAVEQPLFGDKPVDLEDPPYMSQPRRSFHTSSSDWAAKKKKDSNNKQKKPKVAKEQPICGGCPAMKAAENPDPSYVEGSFKKKCRRRAAGTCKGKKIHVDPKDPPPPNPYQKCREKIYSPCLMPREKIVKEEYKKPIDCKDKSYRKFHTSAAVDYKKAGTPTGSSQPLATKPTLKSYSCVETGEEYKTADSQGGGDKEKTLSKHTAGFEAGEHKKGIIARIKELIKRRPN